MTTDTSEAGLERLICTALTGHPCDPAQAGSPPIPTTTTANTASTSSTAPPPRTTPQPTGSTGRTASA
ncbi:MAG: hypothetical protein OXH73_02300 [Caldilineaceae bacterium]|nr:hypothetical protein [Caldilineaceae bacterium]